MRMSVDLPEPLGPRRPKISPRGTCSVTLSSARNVPKSFDTLCTSMPTSALMFFSRFDAEVDFGGHAGVEFRAGVDEHLHAEDLLGALAARLNVARRVLPFAGDAGDVAVEPLIRKCVDADAN